MKPLHLTIITGTGIGVIAVVSLILFFIATPQTLANKPTGDFMDFSANVPFHINATSGETLTVPVDIYSSTTPRNVDIVVTQADSKLGVGNVDPNHPQLPQGFTITLPMKNISMQSMDEKTHEKPLMTMNMTISIDKTVKSGTYGFAINMMSNSTQGLADDHARAFYVDVQ
ncbi:MAG: hypothetical protein KGI27_14375 [Thaumarchaeota archaeon]|nr:hypothetical protein [Nitrososphaerota archaeon]